MDVSRQIAESLPTDLLKEVHKELSAGWDAQKVKAQEKLRRVAQSNFNGVDRTVDGIGQLVARIPPESYHFWGQFFKTYDCWKDKAFLAEFLKDNPECVVNTTKKSQILVDKKIAGTRDLTK